jgi:hypothetical protein
MNNNALSASGNPGGFVCIQIVYVATNPQPAFFTWQKIIQEIL